MRCARSKILTSYLRMMKTCSIWYERAHQHYLSKIAIGTRSLEAKRKNDSPQYLESLETPMKE